MHVLWVEGKEENACSGTFFRSQNLFLVTDLSRLGFNEVDFGEGKPVYGSTVDGGASATAISLVHNGEDGVLVPVFLPPASIKRFEEEMERLTTLELGAPKSNF